MTIEVSICNKDDHLDVFVERVEYDKKRGHPTHYIQARLKPHEVGVFAVHSFRDLRISKEGPR